MFSMEKFGDWLQSQLDKKRWSQADLAKNAHISRGTLSNILSGTRGVGEDTITAIAHALKLPPETVFRAAGILPPASDDPWADEMAFKLAELDPAKRAMAERLIQALAEQEEAEKTKTLKAKRSTG